MATLFKRLVNLTRAHLYDLLEKHASRPTSTPQWDSDFAFSKHGPAEDSSHTSTATAGAAAHAASGLPYSAELARCYTLLDLPFGAPMEEVSKRWKTYLKKCHPDRYANDPGKLAEATELTQALTGAHDTIQAAWKRYQART
jgi:DnaJ-class molecular chaperone